MTKANITQYSSTASSNQDIDDININEGCPASGLNNAIRSLMAHLKNVDTGTQALTALTVTGNGFVGNTAEFVDGTGTGDKGIQLNPIGMVVATRNGGISGIFGRQASDGDILQLRKNGSAVGSIGVSASDDFYISANTANHSGLYFGTNIVYPMTATSLSDNATSIGHSSNRFKDLYLSSGVFLGGTGSANKLDDYEEGTWTPNVGGNSTYSFQTGKYIKVGNHVTLWFALQINQRNSPSAGYLVAGNPFTNNNALGGTGVVHYFANIQTSAVILTTRIDINGSNINVSGATGSAGSMANVNHDWAGNSSQLYGFVTFFSA